MLLRSLSKPVQSPGLHFFSGWSWKSDNFSPLDHFLLVPQRHRLLTPHWTLRSDSTEAGSLYWPTTPFCTGEKTYTVLNLIYFPACRSLQLKPYKTSSVMRALFPSVQPWGCTQSLTDTYRSEESMEVTGVPFLGNHMRATTQGPSFPNLNMVPETCICVWSCLDPLYWRAFNGEAEKIHLLNLNLGFGQSYINF